VAVVVMAEAVVDLGLAAAIVLAVEEAVDQDHP
jgi:hypothetical protein